MKNNILIEASAGTGKTQSLAERLIELVRGGVDPREIVALTFSRAAAGEIFERFVSLLADKAKDDGECSALLRKVIASQHLSQIGTLDSFLMRIVRMFPLELGLEGQVEIMDDFRAGQELARTSFGILRRTDAKTRRAFADAFSLAMNGEDVRSFVDSYRRFVRQWHGLVREHPDPKEWGDPQSVWGEAPEWAATSEEDLSRLADALEGMCSDKAWPDFVEWVRCFRGSFDGMKGFAKKFFELGGELFSHATVDVKYGKKTYSFADGQAKALREAICGVCGYVIRRKLELARGVFVLTSAYEAAYAKGVRASGKLVFDDVPRLLANLPDDVRLALEYRLDAKIRAWALDEFQDTSREQWRALGPLVEEAKQSDGEKSVFIVGDRKQAIYGWRNGDVGIFRREKDGGAYELKSLNKTYRSSEAVVEAVNRVFVRGRLREEFPGWEASEHVSAKPELPGFVQAVTAESSKLEDFFEPVLNALRAVDPVRRGISAAVLVRSNDTGEAMASYLKLNGMDGVVWEGESAILDTPALQGFIDLVKLADHPGYQQAYRHFASTPLAAAMYPDGVPDASAVSQRASQAFTTKGLVRAFRELRALLPEDPSEAWSVFTEERFTDMLRAAAEFELALEPGTRLSDFADFLAGKKKRNIAEPGKVKVMTIHRSKGLGFDYVVLPLYEPKGVDFDRSGTIVGDGWVMPDPGSKVANVLPGLSAARAERRERVEEENLCAYYVAMTRAKSAMTIVCRPPTKTGTGLYISDFVREALEEPIGDPKWHERMPEPERSPFLAAPSPRGVKRAKRQAVKRRIPSLALRSGMSAGELFADFAARNAAMKRGTAVHERLQQIEWVDPSAPKDDVEQMVLDRGWSDAFVKGDAVALWRERSYELLVDGKWESGQLDRVVFRGEGADRRATVYDFKTNAMRPKETREEFERRMQETYAGQLAAYRAAVVSLCALPPERVSCALLCLGLPRDAPRA